MGNACTYNKQAAFTLAETLITLAIIGIIAALTIPNLIQSYKKQVVASKLSKAHTILQNSVKLSEYEYGKISEWELISPQNSAEMLMMVNKYYAPHIKFEKIVESSGGVMAYLPDNTAMHFYKLDNCQNRWDCYAYISYCTDSNACKLNTAISADGKKIFTIYLSGKPPFSMLSMTQQELIDSCKNLRSMHKEACTLLIWKAGMKVPEDYPIKL